MGIPCHSPTRRFFTHTETSPSTLKGFNFLSILLSNEGSLACQTYTSIRLYGSYPRTRDTHTLFRDFGSGTVTTCLYDFRLSRLVFEQPTFRMRGERFIQQGYNRVWLPGKFFTTKSNIRFKLDENMTVKAWAFSVLPWYFANLKIKISKKKNYTI